MPEKSTIMSQQKIYDYFEKNPELKVLFIFNDDFLKEELSIATWEEGYRYIIFNGNWFTCKYLLDTDWKDDKVILYFDSFSPNKDINLRESFPLMDVLVANKEYQNEDYAAFMQQYSIPESMTTFVESNIAQLQSSKMITLLQPYYQDKTINQDIAIRGFLSMYLNQQVVLEWNNILLRTLLLGRRSEKKKHNEFYKKLQSSKLILNTLDKRFMDIFGVNMQLNTEEKVGKIVEILKYNAIVQKLAPSKEDNYKFLRIDDSLALQRMNGLLQLVMSNPRSAEDFKVLLNELGGSILSEEIFKWYGAKADYDYIPEDLCSLILSDILDNGVSSNPNEVIDSIENILLKQNRDTLGIEMDFIVHLAQYYNKASSINLTKQKMPEEYIQFYTSIFFEVDQLYRQILSFYWKISSGCKLYEKLQRAKKSLDLDYAKITNRVNLAWTQSLKDFGSLSSLKTIRQWNFYENQIKSINRKVAVIVCDALRYEIAEELMGEIAKSRHSAKIYPCLATLPTETKFCKPSLLPYKKLELCELDKELNMSVDDKILDNTDKRSDHLCLYKEDAICITFEDVVRNSIDFNRKIFKHPLVYIYHNDIDIDGHSASSEKVVEQCNKSIKRIADLVSSIHASYNVTEVIVTSDHGFLFNDIEFAEKDKLNVEEDAIETKSRYYLTNSKEEVKDIVKFPLCEVSGIKDSSNVMVAVPDGTNRFIKSGGYMFAHGGASLQELIIPVIVSRQERTDVKPPVGVKVLESRLSVLSSRLRFNLLQTEAVGMDNKERVVTVALYSNDELVTPIKEIRLNKTESSLDKRKIQVDLMLNNNTTAKLLQLRVYDIEDSNNPLIKETVTNNTLIGNDFD